MPAGASGREPTTSRSSPPASYLATVAPSAAARRCAVSRAALSPSSMTPTVPTLTGFSNSPAGARAIAEGPPSSSLWAEMPGFRVPRGSGIGAEDDHGGVLFLGQFHQADAGRRVDDDVLRHLRGTDRSGAAVEQLLGLFLLQRFAEGVAYIGEPQLGAADRQQLPGARASRSLSVSS